jgi:Fe-S-cluster-containing hydrogenase component 2
VSNLFRSLSQKNSAESVRPADRFLVINKKRCPQNHPCPAVRVCPVGALKQTGYKAPTVNADQCIKCGKCVNFCPMRALSLSEHPYNRSALL